MKISPGQESRIPRAQYRAGRKAREFGEPGNDKMLEVKVIKLGKLGLAAPVVFASKKYESLRFCVDYWKLNEVTGGDS